MIGGEFVGINVLVVEDDDILRQAVKELLERWGITVHAVHDLEQAEALIRDHGFVPRLVVCDYRLRSGMHGTDVVLGIRNLLGQAVPSINRHRRYRPQADRPDPRSAAFPVLIKPVSPPRLAGADAQPGLRVRSGTARRTPAAATPPDRGRRRDGPRRVDSDRQHAALDRSLRRRRHRVRQRRSCWQSRRSMPPAAFSAAGCGRSMSTPAGRPPTRWSAPPAS